MRFKIQRYNPEIIYFHASESPLLLFFLGARIVKAFDVPLVLHIMDDWPSKVQKLYPKIYHKIDRQLSGVVQKAQVTLVIQQGG